MDHVFFPPRSYWCIQYVKQLTWMFAPDFVHYVFRSAYTNFPVWKIDRFLGLIFCLYLFTNPAYILWPIIIILQSKSWRYTFPKHTKRFLSFYHLPLLPPHKFDMQVNRTDSVLDNIYSYWKKIKSKRHYFNLVSKHFHLLLRLQKST